VAIVGTVKSVLALYGRFRDLIHEAARFGVVGLAALAVTDGGANLLHYDAGVDKFSAAAIATIVATVFSFAASRYWTFRHRDRSGARRETVLFFLVNGVGVAISEGCIGFASALGLTGTISYNVALNGGIALATLFRYWSYRRWVWPAATAASARPGQAGSRRTAKETLRQLPAGELVKFSVVGVLALLCGNGGAFLLHARSGAAPLASGAAGIVVAIAISYAGNRYWTFRHRQRTSFRRESVRYAALYSTGLLIQLFCVVLTAGVLGRHAMLSGETALFIGIGLGAAFRFWYCREWVWPRQHPVPAATRPIMN
jgi:putative flippase GtrA